MGQKKVQSWRSASIFPCRPVPADTTRTGDEYDGVKLRSLTSLIFDFTGAALGTGREWDIGIVSFGAGREALQLMVVAEQTAVSEPSVIVVFGLGLAGLMFARRKRSA